MEYVYAAMLLHSAKKEITESSVESIMKASQVEFDSARVKAIVASLKNINIDEAVSKAAVAPVASAAAAPAAAKEEPKEDTKKTEEEAAAGLGALFG
jgi:large subunit ribosomal protein L12